MCSTPLCCCATCTPWAACNVAIVATVISTTATDNFTTITVEQLDTIEILSLNRPDALNAFNEALYDALTEALREAAADPAVAVVLLTQGQAIVSDPSLPPSGEDAPGPPEPGHQDLLAAAPVGHRSDHGQHQR